MSPHTGISGHVNSENEYATPLFEVFKKDPVDNGTKSSKNQTYYPTSALTQSGPYEFRVETTSNEFLMAPLIRYLI